MGQWLNDALKRPLIRHVRDCPGCGEGDERPLGPNKCGLCECEFIVTRYGTKVRRIPRMTSTSRNTAAE